MTDHQSADFPLLISRSAANDGIRDALRLYVGRGKRFSVKQLANGTGVKDRVIESAMLSADDPDHRRLPPEALLTLCFFLGATFTTEVLRAAAQGAYELPEEEPDPGTLAIASTDDNAKIVRAAMDGEFDNGERDDLRTVGVRMMGRGAHLVGLSKVAA